MTNPPEPSSISNVFGLDNPQHLYVKLAVELNQFMTAQSVCSKNEPYPEALFVGFNVAITAWHITDWLWMSDITNRQKVAKSYGVSYNETPSGIEKGLERFQSAIVSDCRALYICREIANGSKHMKKKKPDLKIKAIAEWHPAIEAVGLAKEGDLVMSLSIYDDQQKIDATKLFIDAFGYWERLMQREGFFTDKGILPQKIISIGR
jgi:hypothetical protein